MNSMKTTKTDSLFKSVTSSGISSHVRPSRSRAHRSFWTPPTSVCIFLPGSRRADIMLTNLFKT
jgi:hypothetical protein